MVCEMISFIGSKAFIIFSVVTGRLVLGLGYDRTFNVQPQPIQFLEEPTDHVTLAGTDVTFVCSTKVPMTDDYSKPNITWLYNNITVKSGHHHIYYYNGSSTLTVKNVTSNDQGVYHCMIDEWRIKIRSRYGHLNVVKNKYQIAYINATWGSTITLPCLPQSEGKSTWLKNKEEKIDYKPNHLSLLEDGSLRLFNVDEDSSGHYRCLVNESNVIRNKSFHITVQKSSKQHTRPRIHSTSSLSQHLLIIPGDCDSSPHNQTVTLQCQVTGYPSPVISWYLNGELVNITEYNITDNVGNNTWIIQDEDPCRLIGYWQCFATNEVGTVHNDIRVLPYGWSTLPRSLALKAISVVQNNDREASASYEISWEPPSYLGGLNLTDIKYNVNISKIGANITNNTYYIIPTKVNVRAALLKSFDVKVDVIYTQINAQYLPASMYSEDVYKSNDLIEIAINFLPPKFTINCLTNGNVVLYWSVQSSGNLSSEYINSFVKSWLFTGSCKNQQGDVYESTKYSEGSIGGEDNYVFHNLSNGTICSYTVSYVYMRNLALSEASSAHCTVIRDDEQFTTSTINIATSTSFILPQASINSSDISSTEVTASSIASTEVSATVLYDSSQTDLTYSSNLFTSSDILNINVTKTNSVQKGLSTSSFLSTRATYSTINLTTIISPPPLHYNDSNKGLPSGLLGTILGLFLLLIAFIAVCTVMIVIYQYKRSRHNNEDYTFLKFSRYLKTIKSPLSNNYCSTINIADESVCEMPTIKVTKWINNNDFQHSASILQQSNSFNSLATSEMIAYICKEGKNKDNKWLCSEGNRLQAEKLDNISCSELSTSSSSIPSHYLCEDNHKDETSSSFIGSVSDHSFQCNSEMFTPSKGSSRPLQTNHLIKKKPTDLLLSEKSTDVPLFTPTVTNSIFPDSYPLTSPPLQSFIESDLLSDILHTLPHADDDVLSQSSDNDSVPSHYLYNGNCSNQERSLSLSDCDNTTHYCDDASNNNQSQCDGEVILTQLSGDIDYDVLAPCHSYHVNNSKPTNLPLPNTSAGMSLFAPQVINPIFAENTNLGSTDSNSLTSMPFNDKDTLNFMLNIQPNEDDGFSQGSSNSDMPSHYFYERNCCNVVSRTSSTSLNEFSHSSSDNIDDSSYTIEENVSMKNSNLCVYREPDSRKSVCLPKYTDQNFTDVSPADSGIYTSLQSSNKINSPNAEFSIVWCKQLDCDEKGLSDLSSNSVTQSPTPSHYMHEQGLSDERNLCHYFDETSDGQIGHNIDTKDSSQTTIDYKSKCSDFCLNKTPVPNSLDLLFVNNSHKLNATNCNLPTASVQSESYRSRVPMKGFDLDTISQFSDSDTNSEFNAYGNSDYGDVNFGYMYVKS